MAALKRWRKLMILSVLFAAGLGLAANKSPAAEIAASCNAFPGSVTAGSVTLEEILARAAGPEGFSAGADPAPIDRARPAKVEVAAFGLG